LELIKDYDLGINYHPGKANVVADALSRRSHLNMLATRELLPEFYIECEKLNLGWVSNTEVIEMEVDSMLEQDIRKGQLEDAKIQEIKEQIKEDKAPGFSIDDQGTLWYKKRICVPEIKEIGESILREAHDSAYSIHPGSTKMYHDLKSRYWWYGIKRAIAEYVALCDNCQRVKAEHQTPAGLLQPLKIPEWKWEEISMSFIVGLPKTQSGYDSIWVIVDRLSKVAHFILVKTTYKGSKLADLYIARIMCLHGVPKKIVSDQGTQFISKFWNKGKTEKVGDASIQLRPSTRGGGGDDGARRGGASAGRVAAAWASEGRRRRRRWAKWAAMLGPKQKRAERLDGPPWRGGPRWAIAMAGQRNEKKTRNNIWASTEHGPN
jgi:hypothetical protein